MCSGSDGAHIVSVARITLVERRPGVASNGTFGLGLRKVDNLPETVAPIATVLWDSPQIPTRVSRHWHRNLGQPDASNIVAVSVRLWHQGGIGHANQTRRHN